ncbi:MAG TPA: bifunctional phosphopantothenoylcysteine decarboxylase/phosphopantothenate--cysteine ligase CoaBC [Kineosporiaceae bacterium]
MILLGVAGGIAAYKACSLLRRFTETGHDVQVVPTASALRFVGEATWSALSGHPVATSVWDDVHEVPHVRLGQRAELVVVAPATADLMARAAAGRADDLLTAVLLTARCPVLLAPAMHTEMWEHPATQANVALLRRRGVVVLDPASGRLTGADTGRGRLPEPEAIFGVARRLLVRGVGGLEPDLAGLQVVISAGGTREPLDPVRYLGNRSSGVQGCALAAAAVARGAKVTLVSANVALPEPAGADVVRVGTALELREAVFATAPTADVVVMAAAVADFRPEAVAEYKIKKSDGGEGAPVVRLVRNPDVLAELVARRTAGAPGAAVIVGFAAETGDDSGDVLHHARAKLERKGCDLLVVNDVSAGKVFGRTDTAVTLLEADGGGVVVRGAVEGDKGLVADAVWDAVVRRLSRSVPESERSAAPSGMPS